MVCYGSIYIFQFTLMNKLLKLIGNFMQNWLKPGSKFMKYSEDFSNILLLNTYWTAKSHLMFALSGAPSNTSHLDINISSILHYLGSPLG